MPILPESAAQPADESGRLQALRKMDILDSPPEAMFDDLTALAAQIVGVPVALVTLIDTERQWFKSHHGLALTQIPRKWAFCAHTILSDTVFEVSDAAQDPRFASNPLVVGEPNIRFYAGTPLRTQDGHNLGTLCVIDRVPRRLDAGQRDALVRLGRQVMHAIEMRQAARCLGQAQDRLQRLADFNTLLAQVNQIIATAQDEPGLLQSICDMAVQYGRFRLAWIGQPDESGAFRFLAASGATGYLEDHIISIDPGIPEGQGSSGRAWREGQALFNDSFESMPSLAPWRELARRLGLFASASLPIRRGDSLWAVLTVYYGQDNAFDADHKAILEELVLDISRGLDRLSLAHREHDLAAMQSLLLDNTLAAIASVREHHLVQVNARFVQMLGYASDDEILGQPVREFYSDDAEYERVVALYPQLIEHGALSEHAVRLRRKDGQIVLCDLSVGLVRHRQGLTAVWTLLDITERHRAQSELSQALAYQRALFEKNAAGIFAVDSSRIIHDVNPAMCEIFGYSRAELVGRSARLLHVSQAAYEHFAPTAMAVAQGRSVIRQEHPFLRKDGTVLTCQILGTPIALPHGEPGVLWSLIDVTALHMARQKITYQALHDTLTDLPNRRALEQYLPKALGRARRNGNVLAVGMLDLDDFKPVNDTYGHEAGDKLLQQFAARLQSRMRESDLLARLGGDEFVLVFEGLDGRQCMQQLEAVLLRLHQAVESPFEVIAGSFATVEISLGLAIYPQDAEDGDALLRHADAALYQAKAHKPKRSQWWQLGENCTVAPEHEPALDPFGAEAAALLGGTQPYFNRTANQFIEKFYAQASHDAEMRTLLDNLTDAEIQSLKLSQAAHLRFLFDPDTSSDGIRAHAHDIGRVHALVGLDLALLTRAIALYRQTLVEELRSAPLMPRIRYHLMELAEARLQDDLQAQMQAHSQTIGIYFAVLDNPLPAAGALWRDALTELLLPIGQLPGVLACDVLRPDTRGRFYIEGSVGAQGQALTQILQTPELEVRQNADSPAGQGLVGQAWRTGLVQSTTSYGMDERLRLWHTAMARLGVRSVVAIPVVDARGKPAFILAIFGVYPNQFEARWVRQFARALQQRASQVWQACRVPPPVTPLPHEVMQSYREHLFLGGLRMHMQPVVDLRSGDLVRVEALARLQLADGQIVLPGVFLPLLGDTELDRLFCMGLDQALAQIKTWEAQGWVVDIAVNLPPSTLLDPECPRWVEEALRRHDIASHRLILELSESQDMDSVAQNQAIDALVCLGSKLAMDDLGSGYSSLQRLSTLPFDTIKVDQSLTLNLRKSPLLIFSLIRTIVQLGGDLERCVVIEGLEDAGMIEAVAILGATQGQGFGLAGPMPADAVMTWRHEFKLPIEPGAIHTFLGALAHHWLHTHPKAHVSIPLATCPLTRFFAEQSLLDSQAAHWHAQVHARQDARASSERLMAWLSERVCQEVAQE